MSDTTFIPGITPITAEWLNEVNDLTHSLGTPVGASAIGIVPTGTVSATTVQGAIEQLAIGSEATDVLATPLSGLSLLTNAAITAADTVLSAFGKLQKQITDFITSKNMPGGLVGMTGFKHNLRNTADTHTSFITTDATAARTYMMPDKDGTVAMTTDIPTSSSAIVLLGTAVVGATVANIDFLSLFSTSYDKYTIEVQGVRPSAEDTLRLRLATGGVVNPTASYANPTANGVEIIGLAGFAQLSVSPTPLAGGITLSVEVRNANDGVGWHKGIGIRGITYRSNGNSMGQVLEGGFIGDSVTGFRIYWANGASFTAGTIRVYGHKKT